ncbi:MAG: hypothetical protein ACI4KB_01140 [Oscillospiraceae bacterium]
MNGAEENKKITSEEYYKTVKDSDACIVNDINCRSVIKNLKREY